VHAHERVDDDRYFEHHAHAEDERRHERQVVRRAQLVLDHLVAEGDEELDRAGKQHEVAEGHAQYEEQHDRKTEKTDEAPLAGIERRIDVRIDLVQDHRHGEGDAAEQRDAQERREVLGRAERDEMRLRSAARELGNEHAVDRDEQDADEGGGVRERQNRADDHRDRGDHEPVAKLPQMLHEGELFVAGGGHLRAR